MWRYFPDNYMWSYQIVRMISQSYFGGGEVNEILDAASKMELGDFESFHREWMNTGHKALSKANDAMDKGNKETAREAYLRSANYFRTAEFFLQPDDERKIPTYLKSVESFKKGSELLDHPPKAVNIPFEHASLPGYFFEAPGQKNGPMMVMFGGLDSTAEELYYGPAQFLNERGISLLALDGPGQGGALRLHHIHSRHDYDVAGTAAYEWAVDNLDVDRDRVGVMAVSMGGYMAARCAAFEPRFKACAIWGAVYDYNDVWAKRPDNHPLAKILQHIFGVEDMSAARAKLQHYNLKGVADKIKAPTYIIHGEDDHQNKVDNAYNVYNDLTCSRHLKIVPKSSPGSSHCQVDNITETYEMYDWIKEQLEK
ncbi:alpha/beta hydrolase family protein [Priestia flexa]|uniref:alpha/beta hydrolase family protein n=1 Tax=Priestia flexa TaxID=86664 RepID=UPI001B31FB3B|nr:alpha/beta hydrolase [Priestia flexa]